MSATTRPGRSRAATPGAGGDRATRHRIGLLVAAGALLGWVPLACGGGDGRAGSEREVAVSDLQREQYFYAGSYLGSRVTVQAVAVEQLTPRSLGLSGGDVGDDTLLVVTRRPVEVATGTVVRVTGTVGQLHRSFPSAGAPYVQQDLYAAHATETYLYDATVG